MDRLSRARRSALMRSVRRTNTSPEMIVRRLVHSMGGRYLTNDTRLPGTPDLVFPGRRTVIFVHGCFWHRHHSCRQATTPKSNKAFWLSKFRANTRRDKIKQAQLQAQGWRVIVVWECETFNTAALRVRLAKELSLRNADAVHGGASSSR